MPDPSEQLIERAKGGDVRAFEQLVEHHIPRVRRFARSMCVDVVEADDIAQEALLKAYTSIRSYRFQSAFSTWLFRIVRNAFIDSIRSAQAKRRARTDGIERASQARAPAIERPDETLAQKEVREQLWQALRELPLEFRTAVVLFDVEGMSHEEIAVVEAVAVGTVKSRLSRGRRQLRAVLTKGPRPLLGNDAITDFVQREGTVP